MSSAKSRSPSDSVNVHMIPLLTPMSVLFIIQSIARQIRKGDNIHPCFTPVLMSNSSVKFWPHITFDLNPSYNIFTVKPLYSEQSRDPNKCSLYGGVHPRGVRYVHAHMCQKYNVPVHMYIKTDLPNLFDF